LQEFFRKLANLLNIITDWLIIILGIALAGKALLAIDVAVAKYTVTGFGIILVVLGFWYRHRRLQRRRKEQEG
jgi:Flp pilus assembly protein TadB